MNNIKHNNLKSVPLSKTHVETISSIMTHMQSKINLSLCVCVCVCVFVCVCVNIYIYIYIYIYMYVCIDR